MAVQEEVPSKKARNLRSIQVDVQRMNGQSVVLVFEEKLTVTALKECILEKLGIPIMKQKLHLADSHEVLQDAATLAEDCEVRLTVIEKHSVTLLLGDRSRDGHGLTADVQLHSSLSGRERRKPTLVEVKSSASICRQIVAVG
eukprot:TRINITY_DN41167_c0_g1_i1.p2 TRINITY_DN41167_c0_g1~~TRINITY_DN41167_c0_g1_i1.p2  ORF type:complete len:143 (-),score=27.60 TRINITY_DN41167_c0_g1_i1:200-628(-)